MKVCIGLAYTAAADRLRDSARVSTCRRDSHLGFAGRLPVFGASGLQYRRATIPSGKVGETTPPSRGAG
jgi:hypothetical protein